MAWYTYILRCSDGSFYVGHTEDMVQRVETHNQGRGAVYTKHRRPVEAVWNEKFDSEGAAVSREIQIKKWSRSKKEALVQNNITKLKGLAKRRK